VLAIFLALLLDQRPTANNDVATSFVNLENFALNNSADVIADVIRTTNVNLASWQEDVHADVDQQTTLDLAGDRTGDNLAFLNRGHHVFPLNDLLSLTLAEDDHVAGFFEDVLVFNFFDQNFDQLPHLRRLFAFFPLILGNSAFALEADVDNDEFFVDLYNLAFDNLIDVELLVGIFQGIEQQLFCGIAEHTGEFIFQGVVFEGADKRTVDHAKWILACGSNDAHCLDANQGFFPSVWWGDKKPGPTRIKQGLGPKSSLGSANDLKDRLSRPVRSDKNRVVSENHRLEDFSLPKWAENGFCPKNLENQRGEVYQPSYFRATAHFINSRNVYESKASVCHRWGSRGILDEERSSQIFGYPRSRCDRLRHPLP